MRRIVGLAIVLGVLACGQMAQAQVTTYSDRTVWNSAASAAPQTEDLNGFVTDTSFQGAVVPLLNMTIEEIDGPTGNGDFYNRIDVFPFQEDGKRSVNGTTYVLGEVDFTTGTFIRIDFSEPVSGWGADFISHDPNAVIDIYDQSNSLIGTTASVAVDTTFYGFLLDAGESAGRIEIRMATIFNDLFGMDDLSFVEGLAADDPTTMTTNLIVAANAPTTLNAGQAGSLTAKLNAVLALIPNGQAAAVSSTQTVDEQAGVADNVQSANGQTRAAVNILTAFIRQVAAFVSNDSLTFAVGQALIADANAVIAALLA